MADSSRYPDRINRVIDYIQHHLDDELTLELLCRVANFSKYHFHRQFSAYAGVTVNRMIQLLRLKRASYQLVFNAQQSITDIALDARFENVESFSRAFKRTFGQTPSQFRKAPKWKPWLEKYQFPTGGNTEMQVNIVDFPETNIAVYRHRGPHSLLNDSIQRFVAWRRANGFSPQHYSTYNLLYDDGVPMESEAFRFDVACAVDRQVEPNDAGVTAQTIPAGRCAVARHVGSSDNIEETVAYLYRRWLPDSGEEVRDFPLFFHRVKMYPHQVSEAEQITDVYLPIK